MRFSTFLLFLRRNFSWFVEILTSVIIFVWLLLLLSMINSELISLMLGHFTWIDLWAEMILIGWRPGYHIDKTRLAEYDFTLLQILHLLLFIVDVLYSIQQLPLHFELNDPLLLAIHFALHKIAIRCWVFQIGWGRPTKLLIFNVILIFLLKGSILIPLLRHCAQLPCIILLYLL